MSEPRPPRSLRTAKMVLVVAVIAVLITAHQLGVLQQFASPTEVKRTLVDLGPWGYLAFVAAYALLQPFGVPGTGFILAAPLIWPWPVAFALSMTGTMAASVTGFSFYRFVARDWVSSKIPERFKKYDEALARRGFVTVALLRFMFGPPPMLHAFFAVSRVPFWTHFWASMLGYAVPVFFVSFFGQRLFDFLYALPVKAWIGLGIAGLLVLVVLWRVRRRTDR